MSNGAHSAQTRTRVRADDRSRCTKPDPPPGSWARTSRRAWQSSTARWPLWNQPQPLTRYPSFAPSKPISRQGTSATEQAQALCLKAIVEALAEGAVELGVMGDDDLRRLQQGADEPPCR